MNTIKNSPAVSNSQTVQQPASSLDLCLEQLHMTKASSAEGSTPAQELEYKRRLFIDIKKVAARARQETQYITVNGDPIYLYTESPNARIGARYGQLGWIEARTASQARAPLFHSLTADHEAALIRQSLPSFNPKTLKASPTIKLEKIALPTSFPGTATQEMETLSSMNQALRVLSLGVLTTALTSQWTFGLGIAVGSLAASLYKRWLHHNGNSENSGNTKTIGLGYGLATYSALSLLTPAELTSVPQHSTGALLILGANLFAVSLLGKKGQ